MCLVRFYTPGILLINSKYISLCNFCLDTNSHFLKNRILMWKGDDNCYTCKTWWRRIFTGRIFFITRVKRALETWTTPRTRKFSSEESKTQCGNAAVTDTNLSYVEFSRIETNTRRLVPPGPPSAAWPCLVPPAHASCRLPKPSTWLCDRHKLVNPPCIPSTWKITLNLSPWAWELQHRNTGHDVSKAARDCSSII